eukprot:s1767_g1.t1
MLAAAVGWALLWPSLHQHFFLAVLRARADLGHQLGCADQHLAVRLQQDEGISQRLHAGALTNEADLAVKTWQQKIRKDQSGQSGYLGSRAFLSAIKSPFRAQASETWWWRGPPPPRPDQGVADFGRGWHTAKHKSPEGWDPLTMAGVRNCSAEACSADKDCVPPTLSRDGLNYQPRFGGPFFCILASLFLCMADLTRHLVNDAWGTSCTELPDGDTLGIFGSGGGAPQLLGSNFNKYCQPGNVANEYTSTGALSVWGWLFTIFFTWSGFAFLLVGICWAISLPRKVATQWRTIRARRASRQSPILATGV